MSAEFNQSMNEDSQNNGEQMMDQQNDEQNFAQEYSQGGDNGDHGDHGDNGDNGNNGDSQDGDQYNGNGTEGNGTSQNEENGTGGTGGTDEANATNGNGDTGNGEAGSGAPLEPEQFRKVFIGGLSYKTDDDALKAYFSKYGELVDHVVMKDGQTGRSRGFGFVTYSNSSMVDELMKNRPHIIDGRQVEPKRATPREVGRRICGHVSF